MRGEFVEGTDLATIHARAREAFGWTEFGYISAAMYKLHNVLASDDGIGVAGDMQIDFRMNEGQMRAFMTGWKTYLVEWDRAHQGTS